jgi:hypothetical protein
MTTILFLHGWTQSLAVHQAASIFQPISLTIVLLTDEFVADFSCAFGLVDVDVQLQSGFDQ